MDAEIDLLHELALDLRWAWNHSADQLWAQIDPELWGATLNPWVVLQTVSHAKLKKILEDPEFKQKLTDLIQVKRERDKEEAWFQKNHDRSVRCIAYFCMEFMLSEALPIYSGGLGNVAGDQLKAASDLGVPVVGVGLLYSKGYFRQSLDKSGWQKALYPYNDPNQLPIRPLRRADGEWLRIAVDLPGFSIWLRTWEAQVGRTRLYLLDSNDAANHPFHRGITNELYGGDLETRLKQELILGIGGWRLIQAIGLQPEVCHLNEGHAAFAILERAAHLMEETKQPFWVAWTAARVGNLFTTHTAEPSGFDWYPPELLEVYLGRYAKEKIKIPFDDFLSLGRRDPKNRDEHFNMAYLAIRGSGAVNGVSELHCQVSRDLFQPLFPSLPNEEIPIGFITNGVHTPTWDSPEADSLWTRYCGKSRWLGTTEELQEKMKKVPDEEIWQMREASRQRLVDFSRKLLSLQISEEGASEEKSEEAKECLNPKALTLCFARRFVAYKRPTLLLSDPARLIRILTHPEKPVQLILAGKAHPSDKEGQKLIQDWIDFISQSPEVRSHVVFLADYDMLMTEQFVQGADLWINTPRRPWEACGTSGMKVLVNGGLNLSELDGWWSESYNPDVGWAIGDREIRGEDPAWDQAEAADLYDLLEHEIVPSFYLRNEAGIPESWIAKVRNSMARLTPYFSANRSVTNYVEKYYLHAAHSYRERTSDQNKIAKSIVEWEDEIERNWMKIWFGQRKIENRTLQIELHLGPLSLSSVIVELYSDGTVPFIKEMKKIGESDTGIIFQGEIPTDRSIEKAMARVRPFHPHANPLETTQVLWESTKRVD